MKSSDCKDLCTVRLRVTVWCGNYSLFFLRVPDEWRFAADEWRGRLEVRRGGEESSWCGCREEWLRGSKSSFAYLCIIRRFTPSFLPFSPSFLICHPPPSTSHSTPLFSLLHSSSQPLYLLSGDFPAPFMPFNSGSPSCTLLHLLFISGLFTD